jgi:hypothetical protein
VLAALEPDTRDIVCITTVACVTFGSHSHFPSLSRLIHKVGTIPTPPSAWLLGEGTKHPEWPGNKSDQGDTRRHWQDVRVEPVLCLRGQ